MKIRTSYTGIMLLVTALAGCSRNDTDVDDFGYNYYPVAQGDFILYNYKEYIYNDFNHSIDTINYELKELVDSAFLDGEGRGVFLLKRFNRLSDTLDWSLLDIWTITPGKDQLERMEENVSYVELSFPLQFGKTWNGNARNVMAAENYQVVNFDLNWRLNGVNFDKICRITKRDQISLISENFAETIYARRVGPILIRDKKVKKDVDGNILSGYDRTWTYIYHGKQ